MFGALIEFAVVNYYSRQDKDKKIRKRLNALGVSVAAARARGDSEFGLRTGSLDNQQGIYGSTRPHRRRVANRTTARKKFESGKDSGIESDDLEEVIATRYVKSLGATKLSSQANKNSPPLQEREHMPLSGHRDSAGGFSLNENGLPQYDSPSTSNKKPMFQNQLNSRQASFASNQPIYRGSQSNENENGQTNFVNLVVDSQSKTNPIHSKRSRNFFMNWLNRFPTTSKRIDVLSRIFFPLLFAMFNVFYWVTYLFRDLDLERKKS